MNAQNGMEELAAVAPEIASGEKANPEGWSLQRWLMLIALVFIAHVALIFLFDAKGEISPRPARNVPQLQLVDNSEWLALENPTLFALRRAQNFYLAFPLRFAGNSMPLSP